MTMGEDDFVGDGDFTEFVCPVCHDSCDVDAEFWMFTDDLRDECTSKCPMCGAAVVVRADVEVTLTVSVPKGGEVKSGKP